MIRSMDGAEVVSAVSNFEIYGRNLVLTIGLWLFTQPIAVYHNQGHKQRRVHCLYLEGDPAFPHLRLTSRKSLMLQL